MKKTLTALERAKEAAARLAADPHRRDVHMSSEARERAGRKIIAAIETVFPDVMDRILQGMAEVGQEDRPADLAGEDIVLDELAEVDGLDGPYIDPLVALLETAEDSGGCAERKNCRQSYAERLANVVMSEGPLPSRMDTGHGDLSADEIPTPVSDDVGDMETETPPADETVGGDDLVFLKGFQKA